MKINIHAGHNPKGKVACGAIGLIDESTENRNVVKELKAILEKEGLSFRLYLRQWNFCI